MVWNKQKLKTAVVACLVALTVATDDFSHARELGDRTQLDPILKLIARLLDKDGIDVFAGNETQEPGERPRVGLFSDFSIREQLPTSNPESQSWTEKFQLGRLGAIAFVPKPRGLADSTAINEKEFLRVWEKTPGKLRVFLSFTREDLKYADRIEPVLKSNNYVVFKYLK